MSPRRIAIGLALTLLIPAGAIALWLGAESWFPDPILIAPGPGYSAIADHIERRASDGRMLVDPDNSAFSLAAKRRRAHVFARVEGDDAFTRLREPADGEWLDEFAEPGQTYAEWVAARHQRKTSERHTLHLQPYHDLTPLHASVLGDLETYVATFFDSAVVTLPVRRIELGAWNPNREQWDASYIADRQRARVPDDSMGLFGLVGGDLYALQLGFVFGIGRFRERVGVHSLHRYGDDAVVLRQRAIKLAAHELGHMFGIEHCIFYACVMNGVNTREELDRSPPHLCPVCHEKLRSAINFQSQSRYEKLAVLYASYAMPEAAAFAAARASE